MVKTPAQNRNMADLEPITRAAAVAWIRQVKNVTGFDILVTETARTRERQKFLYGQGRVGVPYARSGPILTYVSGDNSFHRYRGAFDFVVLLHGVARYDLVAEVVRKVSPGPFGLASLSFEKCHLQRAFAGKNPNILAAAVAAKIAGLKLA
jgi:hypothetical protein